ncbi:hypothetical protein KKG82_04635, partial [Patescibacteria group bacterium]|nr:hypothetical protein [Patescibacteria group bacterium]
MSKTTVEIRYSEREIIAIRIRMKWSYSRIGWFLGRDHSVIRREIIRNRTRSGIYDAMYAQKVADSRKKKTNRAKIDTHPYLQKYIIERIRDDRLSPEQVAGRLRVAPPPELVGVTISHESIYLWIYNHARWLCQYLRRKIYTRRQKRYSRKKQYRY